VLDPFFVMAETDFFRSQTHDPAVPFVVKVVFAPVRAITLEFAHDCRQSFGLGGVPLAEKKIFVYVLEGDKCPVT
jgi:hypothetical protein